MKFKVGDKVCMIGNDIAKSTGLERGMEGIIFAIDTMRLDDWSYLVKWKCGEIWTKEYQMKLIK